jgi:thiosulfate sulfurtransferase
MNERLSIPSVNIPKLREAISTKENWLVLDVRRQPAFDKNPVLLPGAVRVAPEAISNWAASAPTASKVVAYCVYGHEVSQAAVATLRSFGIDAYFLEGGITHWQKENGTVTPFKP